MAQAIVAPTPAMQAGAEQLLAEPARWTPARRPCGGRPFFIVRGRTGTYYTSPDACTCPGWQRRHLCSHSLAAAIHRDRERAAQPAPAPARATCGVCTQPLGPGILAGVCSDCVEAGRMFDGVAAIKAAFGADAGAVVRTIGGAR